jgi:pimeloyl-ACP methyl ester carboxylesterase
MLRVVPLAGLTILLLRMCVAVPALGEDLFFNSDGLKIRYTIDGQGPPVVLIHGYRASGDLNWRLPAVIGLLGKNYRVITLDNRGHGKSDKPRDVDQYGPKMAEDVVRLMDHLHLESAHLVGYSMGGMITLKLLATHPDRVRSAVIGGMGWTELPTNGQLDQTADKLTDLEPLRACALSFPQLGITREELVAVKVPTMIVIGAEDGLLTRRVEPLRKVRPDLPIVQIAGANHAGCIFRPEFRHAIEEFLDKQVSESSLPKPPADSSDQ